MTSCLARDKRPYTRDGTKLISAADGNSAVKRRRVVGLFALVLATGCVDRWPRPTGPRGAPEAPEQRPRDADAVRIDSWDFGETESGRLRVFGTVQNGGDTTAEATVKAVVYAGDERYEQTKTVTVPAGETAEFDIEFDVRYETFLGDGSIDLDLR